MTDFETATPDMALTKSVVSRALKRGLILLSCGMQSNALRIMIAPKASDGIIEEGLMTFEAALAEAVAERAAWPGEAEAASLRFCGRKHRRGVLSQEKMLVAVD